MTPVLRDVAVIRPPKQMMVSGAGDDGAVGDERGGKVLAAESVVVQDVAFPRADLAVVADAGGPPGVELADGLVGLDTVAAGAREEFDRAVDEAGFVVCAALPNTGCSPDGVCGEGLVEIKCPASMAKHLDALRTGDHAKEYRWQLQHQMMVTDAAWVDAVSYDPRYPEHLQLAIVRVARDEAAIAELREAIKAADAEVEAIVNEMRNKSA